LRTAAGNRVVVDVGAAPLMIGANHRAEDDDPPEEDHPVPSCGEAPQPFQQTVHCPCSLTSRAHPPARPVTTSHRPSDSQATAMDTKSYISITQRDKQSTVISPARC